MMDHPIYGTSSCNACKEPSEGRNDMIWYYEGFIHQGCKHKWDEILRTWPKDRFDELKCGECEKQLGYEYMEYCDHVEILCSDCWNKIELREN